MDYRVIGWDKAEARMGLVAKGFTNLHGCILDIPKSGGLCHERAILSID